MNLKEFADLYVSQAKWVSEDQPIGESVTIWRSSNTSATWINNDGMQYNDGTFIPWQPEVTTPWQPDIITTTGTGPYVSPAPTPTPTYPPIYIPTPPQTDEHGSKVIKAIAPSLEQVLVEIAKVLRDGGDILEVRAIFERYKLKLVDHDGEVIFDPKDLEKLEGKGF